MSVLIKAIRGIFLLLTAFCVLAFGYPVVGMTPEAEMRAKIVFSVVGLISFGIFWLLGKFGKKYTARD